jgi:hypothetical protein
MSIVFREFLHSALVRKKVYSVIVYMIIHISQPYAAAGKVGSSVILIKIYSLRDIYSLQRYYYLISIFF